VTLTARGYEAKTSWLGVASVLITCACTSAAKRCALPGAQEPLTNFEWRLPKGCELQACRSLLHSSASHSSVLPQIAALCAAFNLLTFKRAWFDVPGWF
jgi:hypothetical protein